MKHLIKKTILALLISLLTMVCKAQSYEQIVTATKTEPSVAFLVSPSQQNNYLEADIFGHYYLRISKYERETFSITPQIKTRFDSFDSLNIITPEISLTPALYHRINIKKLNVIRYITVKANFRTNGKKEKFLKNNTINYANGRFTTYFIKIGLNTGRPLKQNSPTNWLLAYSLDLQYHPPFFLLDDVLYQYYNNIRINTKINFINNYFKYTNGAKKDLITAQTRTPDIQLKMHVSLLVEPFYEKRLNKMPFTFSFKTQIRPWYKSDLSIFSEFYYGEDYYNLYFTQNVAFIKLGVCMRNLNMQLF